MRLVYHVYPKDQWRDPHEGMHPFVSKRDYDALAAELGKLKEARELGAKASATLRDESIAKNHRIKALEAALRDLHAMVWGECPSLLNEDSGGSGHLDTTIRDLLTPSETDLCNCFIGKDNTGCPVHGDTAETKGDGA